MSTIQQAMAIGVTSIVEGSELLRAHKIQNFVVLIGDMRDFGQNGYLTVDWVMEIDRQIVQTPSLAYAQGPIKVLASEEIC